ncbi:c-type cytochrome [Pyruvatibacter sp.]|uniref:c-type cytochrome n=1 Tax=Pyruvatibacter sp. TaxID=1981328 RepID=UPI002969BDB7|nr:c-type cytochrome [Alphaproteobacteria bacterium]
MRIRALTAIPSLILAIMLAPATAHADFSAEAEAGEKLAQNLCSSCHALEADGLSPNDAAPNFHELVLAYPADHLAEGFAEGIVVGTDAHVGMPQFQLDTTQIDNLIAYLETILPPPPVPHDDIDEGDVIDY